MIRDYITKVKSDNLGVAKASKEVEDQVSKELKIKDPNDEKSNAALDQNIVDEVEVDDLDDAIDEEDSILKEGESEETTEKLEDDTTNDNPDITSNRGNKN